MALMILAALLSWPVVFAQTNTEVEQVPIIRLLREFSVFLNVVLVILVILLFIGLYGSLKYLGGEQKLTEKIKLVLHFLKQEPASVFSEIANRDKRGTYLKSFEKFRSYHLFSRKTFLRTLGIIIVQIVILAILLYGLAVLTHSSKAQETNSLQSKNFQLELKK